MTHPIINNFAIIKDRIQTAEVRFHRPYQSVQLLAISKTFSATDILQLHKAGQLDFGESYLQEALPKILALAPYSLQWHFVGHLQSNKLKTIAEHFHWVHSVQSVQQATQLSKHRPPHLPGLNLCIQIKTDPSDQKKGAALEMLPILIPEISRLPNIKLRGFMTLPPPTQDFDSQRKYFSILTKIFNHYQAAIPTLDTLSMGTTGDLEAAIAEGATLVRIGTGLFGPRQK